MLIFSSLKSSLNDSLKYQTIASIPANTYSTYALALAALVSEYARCSYTARYNSFIIIGDMRLAICNVDTPVFSKVEVASSNVYVHNISIGEKTYKMATISSGGLTVQDRSSNAQDLRIELACGHSSYAI